MDHLKSAHTALEPIHVLIRIDDCVLPIQPRRRRFDTFGFFVLHHFFKYGELVRRQTVMRERLPPTLELILVRHVLT
jgi:hypothetical protein